MDENGFNYRLTTKFDDGDEVIEYYVTERGVESAKKTWLDGIESDKKQFGITYSIESFEVVGL